MQFETSGAGQIGRIDVCRGQFVVDLGGLTLTLTADEAGELGEKLMIAANEVRYRRLRLQKVAAAAGTVAART